ncbi:hypothetical protein JCM6882_006614 [Rhodosporidiobolus microsporus]
MDDHGAAPPSASTPAPSAERRARGPPPRSCQPCRLRRIKCVRTSGADEPCEQCSKKGIVCVAVPLPPPSARTGKRIESAKQLYGTLNSSSSAATVGALVPSGLSTRLADGEMSESLGLELLTLYGDAGSSCCQPLFPPPVLDYIALRNRFRDAGRRLSDMSLEDQLVGRIVFATASRLRTGNSSSPDPRLSQQLLANAQTRADAAAVWRNPSPSNAVSLLLLYQLVSRGEIGSEEAKPYLSALVGHMRALERTNPEFLRGASLGGTTGLVWCLMAFDAFAAVEQAEEPIVPEKEYDLRLRPLHPGLPSLELIRFALESDPWSLTNYALVPLAAIIEASRRLARCLDEVGAAGGLRAETERELEELWERAWEVGSWGSEIIELSGGMKDLDPFTVTVLGLWVQLSYGAAVFSQLAIVLSLENRHPAPTSLLSQQIGTFPSTACRYLRSIRGTAGRNNFLTVFTGCAWSVSRLMTFARIFVTTNAWSTEMHPGGPADKLASLNFLHGTLTNVATSYPSASLSEVIQLIESERPSLQILFAAASSGASSTSASPSSSNTAPSTSLARISTWTHMLVEEERKAVQFRAEVRSEQWRKTSFFGSRPIGESPGAGGVGGGGSITDSPPDAPPGVTWEDLGFDYQPASRGGGASSIRSTPSSSVQLADAVQSERPTPSTGLPNPLSYPDSRSDPSPCPSDLSFFPSASSVPTSTSSPFVAFPTEPSAAPPSATLDFSSFAPQPANPPFPPPAAFSYPAQPLPPDFNSLPSSLAPDLPFAFPPAAPHALHPSSHAAPTCPSSFHPPSQSTTLSYPPSTFPVQTGVPVPAGTAPPPVPTAPEVDFFTSFLASLVDEAGAPSAFPSGTVDGMAVLGEVGGGGVGWDGQAQNGGWIAEEGMGDGEKSTANFLSSQAQAPYFP